MVYGVAPAPADATDLAMLLRQAAGNAPHVLFFNEPEGSVALALCRELGFTEAYRQHEMSMAL
jgi:hypothetical protein